ncbi:MAG: ribonuclease P protein component [Candidatus Sungbacteria bacterium]|uniref:Ribonuclease P protein component n=1 Tax=Candidatus Sungiibacteriota bacterium TaxID=2750080 RepID=A0A9D6QRV5_9BACT|nr:ribonuclease P protein component [Candidatus Sungbacteria bacterium]
MPLPKSARLSKDREIQAVFKKSKRAENDFFILRVHYKQGAPGRMAIVISKGVSKKATDRVRLRRRISEWVRQNKILKTKTSDYVLSVKPSAMGISRTHFYQSLGSLWKHPQL